MLRQSIWLGIILIFGCILGAVFWWHPMGPPRVTSYEFGEYHTRAPIWAFPRATHSFEIKLLAQYHCNGYRMSVVDFELLPGGWQSYYYIPIWAPQHVKFSCSA